MLACDQQRYNNRVGLCPLRPPPLKPATGSNWMQKTQCRTSPCTLSLFLHTTSEVLLLGGKLSWSSRLTCIKLTFQALWFFHLPCTRPRPKLWVCVWILNLNSSLSLSLSKLNTLLSAIAQEANYSHWWATVAFMPNFMGESLCFWRACVCILSFA